MIQLADVLERLTREQLASIITEAAEANARARQMLLACAVYETMPVEEQQALHERLAEESTEGMEPWLRAIEDLGWE